MDFFKSYFGDANLSRNNLCFIECNGNNLASCGCLNRLNPSSSYDSDFYSSSCYNEKNERTNYGMIYSINKNNSLFKNKIE